MDLTLTVFWCSSTIAALNHAEAERKRKEEAEYRAKLDEIAEKQRQRERELEEKERLRKEALLGRPAELPRPAEPRPVEPAVAAPAAAAAAAPAPGKYVPRFRRGGTEPAAQTAPDLDRRASRPDDRPPPSSDRWRSDERRPPTFGGSKSSWSSSRVPSRGSER